MTFTMSPLAFALALFVIQPADGPAAPAAPAADVPAATPEPDFPPGAPRQDYPFVAWCYGNLRAYLELHDEVMPEVTRIESTYRPPGRKLSDDLKVYADQQAQGRADLKRFQAAMTAAEKASLRPINTVGAEAVRRGRQVWIAPPGVSKARMAQEWMSWTLPARCQTTAKSLEERATLMGASFQVNTEPQAPATEAPAPEAAPAVTASDQAVPADAPPAPDAQPK
jgi:hypothetical protein